MRQYEQNGKFLTAHDDCEPLVYVAFSIISLVALRHLTRYYITTKKVQLLLNCFWQPIADVVRTCLINQAELITI